MRESLSMGQHDTGSQQGETGRMVLAIWIKGSMHVVGTSFGSEGEVGVWGGTLAEGVSQWDSLMGTAWSHRWTSCPCLLSGDG